MRIHIFNILLLVAAFSFSSAAQTAEPFTFFNDLQATTPGKGTVQVFQDPRLAKSMAEFAAENKKKGNKDHIFMYGYRVQVYTSNVPKIAKEEAFKLDASIKAKHPNEEVYITYVSPFWKVRVGDCQTYREANNLLEKLKEEFPKIKDSFYIVKEDIKIPLH